MDPPPPTRLEHNLLDDNRQQYKCSNTGDDLIVDPDEYSYAVNLYLDGSAMWRVKCLYILTAC